MLRLYVDFSNPVSLGPLAAAHKNGNVEIITLSANTGVLLMNENSSVIRSRNAIVCFLVNSDPLERDFVDILLWESSILRPAINCYAAGNLAELQPLFRELQESVFVKMNTLSSASKTALQIILWADLVHIFSKPVSGCDVLKKIFDGIHTRPYCSSAFNELQTGSSSKSLSPSDSVLQQALKLKHKVKPQSTKTNAPQVDGGDIARIDEANELLQLEVDVTPEHLLAAQRDFSAEFVSSMVPKLPVNTSGLKCPAKKDSGLRNILVTSALPYVNNVPHLGNLIGSLLSADTFSRYCKSAGYNVLSICGTDEYGTATEFKAQLEGLTPQQITDKYFALHRKIYEWFDIVFDHFGRTSTPKHTEITQELFTHLHQKGYISVATLEQLNCGKCSRPLADRFVEGVCPTCKSADARGDQCDSCGRLINAVELLEPRCSVCGTRPQIRSSEHLFLDLPKLQDKVNNFLRERINDPSSIWTPIAASIASSWLRDGLKQRCITRDLKWGVPVPLEKFSNKVFYVWFDAPIGYISITANYTPDWRLWWQPPADIAPIEYFQFMAKDNVPFHASIFPACLLGVNEGYTLVKNLIATHYLNYDGQKFSKSRSIGVFGDNAKDTGIESNIFRFYLLYVRPESQDSSFSWEDFENKNNCELLNNLGNFINRPLCFLAKFFNSTIPSLVDLNPEDVLFIARINILLKLYLSSMEQCHLRDGLRYILAISRLGNGYIQAQKPWTLVKSESTVGRAGVVTGVASNVAALLGILLSPFMPSVSKDIFSQCNLPLNRRSLTPVVKNGGQMICLLSAEHHIGEPKPLFKKIESSDTQRFKKMFAPS